MSSIASRVALTTALSIALSSAVVALVGALLAEHFAQQDEDARLLDAANTLAFELREPGADPDFVTRDETEELAHAELRFAVREGARFVAGDPALPTLAAGTCSTDGPLRACAVRVERDRVAIAAHPPTLAAEQRARLSGALLAAVALTTLLGALFARRIASASVRPLTRLTAEITALDRDASRLGASEGVAEVDALRDTLRTTLARLADALAHSQRFAGDAAHELRTPLTAIRGELELAAETSSGDEAASIARALRITSRLALLVDRLLVLAVPSGALEASEPVRIEEVVDEVRITLPKGLADRVRVTGATASPLDGDGALLGAMLGSGLENALKYSEGPVDVRLIEEGDAVVIEIDDEGPGVPSHEREALFRPFHRSPSALRSAVRGQGIGLALVLHVAALHGGTARFEDGAVGARLSIRLRRAR